MRQRMKHESITNCQNQKDRQLSGQKPVKTVQSDRKLKHHLAKLWTSYFGIPQSFIY